MEMILFVFLFKKNNSNFKILNFYLIKDQKFYMNKKFILKLNEFLSYKDENYILLKLRNFHSF